MNVWESSCEPWKKGKQWGTFNRVIAAVVVIAVLVALLLPALQPARSGRRHPCMNNLKSIGLALQNYHDQQRMFPPAYVADEKGQPMHSWRALLLPFFEDPTITVLAKEYRFDEPWDGPNNRKLAAKMPAVFRCPNTLAGENDTSYVAVVGPETAWPSDTSVTIRTITDGTSKTIMLVEMADSGINWLEPRDLTFEQATQGVNPLSKLSISSGHEGGANFLFCDCSVHYLADDIPPETLRALLTRDGGEDVEIPSD